MKVVIINKSDARGGAAIVSARLMRALRNNGVEASMLVAEKLTDDANIYLAASPNAIKRAFLRDRLAIFAHNGQSRKTLFKADAAVGGLPLYNHPLVKEADVVCLGWINQGLLSLRGIEKIATLGKPIVWTMHDKWCATGLCHHSGECKHYIAEECGECPLLHWQKSAKDYSHTIWRRKHRLYTQAPITFVAVSHWLKEQCAASKLMACECVEVIGNPVIMPPYMHTERNADGKLRLLMVAARLDDPIKGLDTLCDALRLISSINPEIHSRIELTLLGELKNASLLHDITIPVHTPGAVRADQTEGYYRRADMLLSSSRFETLPGTLVEAQMWGALPVAFDSGGQRDIVREGQTGVLAKRTGEPGADARAFAQAIIEGAKMLESCNRADLSLQMYESVEKKFDQKLIAQRYIELFNRLTR